MRILHRRFGGQASVLKSEPMTPLYIERDEVTDEVRRLVEAIWRDFEPGQTAAECSPPLDVLETDHAIEVLMDLPGVPREDIHVVFANNVLIIAGRKLPPACDHSEAAFHLAERAFGRFARAVSLEGAFESANATATVTNGELRVSLPRIAERRGGHIRIPVRG
jgi:HSP20 family protein